MGGTEVLDIGLKLTDSSELVFLELEDGVHRAGPHLLGGHPSSQVKPDGVQLAGTLTELEFQMVRTYDPGRPG